MDTFLNAQIEDLKIEASKMNIHQRINLRGSKEQFASVLLTCYNESFAKYRLKDTVIKGCVLVSRYN